MNMHVLRNYKNRYCDQCPAKGCSGCKVKSFVNYIGVQETPSREFNDLMRASVPTNVKHNNGKFVQKNGLVLK